MIFHSSLSVCWQLYARIIKEERNVRGGGRNDSLMTLTSNFSEGGLLSASTWAARGVSTWLNALLPRTWVRKEPNHPDYKCGLCSYMNTSKLFFFSWTWKQGQILCQHVFTHSLVSGLEAVRSDRGVAAGERGPFTCSSVLDLRWRRPGRCSGEKLGSETHEPRSPYCQYCVWWIWAMKGLNQPLCSLWVPRRLTVAHNRLHWRPTGAGQQVHRDMKEPLGHSHSTGSDARGDCRDALRRGRGEQPAARGAPGTDGTPDTAATVTADSVWGRVNFPLRPRSCASHSTNWWLRTIPRVFWSLNRRRWRAVG